MFLSLLKIDVGDNPDRGPGRLWLRNLYHVHQRLCMAFPYMETKSADEHFLQPFKPDDFDHRQLHTIRKTDAGFLFRIEPRPAGRAVILVQSAIEPDWDYAFQNAGYLLAAPADVKVYELRFKEGERMQFRLLANPTRKIDTKSGSDGQKRNGKRVPVRDDQLVDWLVRQAESWGVIEKDCTTIQPGYIYVNKERRHKI